MDAAEQSSALIARLGSQKVIPILEIENRQSATDLAKLLVDEDISVIEVVLRTRDAVAAIEIMAAVEGCCAGAGSVTTGVQFAQIVDAGAAFAVSPGVSPAILEFALNSPIPILPGAMTPSEALHLQHHGYHFMKLFPAGSAGGPDYIRSITGPIPDIAFCPTGGVNEHNLPSYLDCKPVLCVGGSWITPRHAITACDWSGIRNRIRATRSIIDQHARSRS